MADQQTPTGMLAPAPQAPSSSNGSWGGTPQAGLGAYSVQQAAGMPQKAAPSSAYNPGFWESLMGGQGMDFYSPNTWQNLIGNYTPQQPAQPLSFPTYEEMLAQAQPNGPPRSPPQYVPPAPPPVPAPDPTSTAAPSAYGSDWSSTSGTSATASTASLARGGSAPAGEHPFVTAMHQAGFPGLREPAARGGKKEAKVLSPQEIRKAYKTLLDPAHRNPKLAVEAARVLHNMTIPLGANKDDKRSGYYNLAQPVDVSSVQSTVNPIPGVSMATPTRITWDKALKGMGKNASVMLLGGDRSRYGRITHIMGKPLAWPVDLHAGPSYMRGPNPDEAWLVGKGTPANRLHKKIKTYSEKGPVFGVYAPMGARSADSSHNMLDLLLSQIPGSGVSQADLEKFDDDIRQGKHWRSITKDQKAKLANWPGIANDPKAVSDFVRPENGFSGAHRAAIVKHMDKKSRLDKGFPAVGITRVAMTDPQFLTSPDNTMGGYIVHLDPALSEKALNNPYRFIHSTYQGEPVGGTPYAGVDLIQRQFGIPDVTEKMMSKMTSPGENSKNVPELIHPMSPGATGRSSYGQMTSLHNPVQPVNQRMIDSIAEFYEKRSLYPKKAGGSVIDRALKIASSAARRTATPLQPAGRRGITPRSK